MLHCNADIFQVFLNKFSVYSSDEFKFFLLDNGAFHKTQTLTIPDNMDLHFIPSYSPELNSAEKYGGK